VALILTGLLEDYSPAQMVVVIKPEALMVTVGEPWPRGAIEGVVHWLRFEI